MGDAGEGPGHCPQKVLTVTSQPRGSSTSFEPSSATPSILPPFPDSFQSLVSWYGFLCQSPSGHQLQRSRPISDATVFQGVLNLWQEKTDASIADSNVNQPRIQKLIRRWRPRRQSRGGVPWVARGWLLRDLSGSCALLPYSCSILGVYTFILEKFTLNHLGLTI